MNLPSLAIKRPIFITCIVALMLILGVISMKRMSVDLFPDVTFPTISVQTLYPGASPQDLEKLVAKPIEDEMGSLNGLDKLYSQNAEGVSSVILMFKIGTDVKDMEQQIRQRLGNIRNKLPDEIEEPVVRRFDPADQPIAQIAVTSPMPPAQLFDLADQTIKNQFETINGVGLVQIIGGRKREIQVMIDKDKLQDRQLSLLQISERIKNTSRDVPVGTLKNSKNEVVVRANGEFESIDAIRDVNVNFLGSDQGVKLSTVARVQEGLEDEVSEFAFRSKANDFQRQAAISMNVYKQSGANTVEIVDLVKARIEKTNELLKTRGLDAQVNLVRETSRPIRLNIADVRESILIGVGLCVLVVFFFLGSAKSTFITGMALPNSLLGGFVIMYASGFTINILTLLALSLAVGLLIDDAIVVRENIFRHIEMGKSPKQASLEGTKEVALAVLATTLVVIAVFGPIAFLQGIIGQFFKQFGLTVVFTMLISLFDAFTVAPMLSTYLATRADHVRGKGPVARMLNAFDRFQSGLENLYEKAVHWVVRRRGIVLGLAFLIFVSSLLLAGIIPKNFLPQGDNGEFQVTLELPLGTSLVQTKEFVKKVEEVVTKNPAVELTSTVAGYTNRPEANKASIYVRLVPRKERNGNTSQIKTEVRQAVADLQKQALIAIGDIDIGGGGQKILQLSIRGENLDELSAFVEKLKPRIAAIHGLTDVDTNYRTGKPEFQIVFNREKAESLGVSTAVAGSELRARVEGVVAATYRLAGNEYDIRVRMDEDDRNIRDKFSTTRVPNVNFNMIPLATVAVGKEVKGYSQINRLNKGRYIMIDANLGPGGNLGTITQEIEKLLASDADVKLPAGITYEFLGQAEDFKILIQNMLMAMGLGVLLIYLVLASLYESFITPITILTALPLAMTGAFAGLMITGKSIDLFSMIGIVMLMGVVAKNSILLVDYTHVLMDEGMDRTQALIKACKTRLRPIMMTSFALIAGTIPIAIGLNEASAQRTSMGVAIIGGLISSTFLTLLVVPASFEYVDDFRRWVNRHLRKISGHSEPPAGATHTETPAGSVSEPQLSK
ncbi:MAG: efflux RND transporter permease subunit [Pseudobdellovibrionaceae bacterium]